MNMKFLGDVLPPEGKYALFIKHKKRHEWFDTLTQLNNAVEAYSANGVRDVYFATASYKTSASREQANVRQLKALRLDVDAGEAKFAKHPDGAYETRNDAVAAVVQYSVASKLAPSYIVSSGEGLHIYYVLDEAVGPNIWGSLANRLKASVNEHGLAVDPTTTLDSARILRPIGSLHTSGAEVRVLKATGRTYTLDALDALLPQVEPIIQAPTAMSAEAARVNDEAVTYAGPPRDILKIVRSCAAINYIGRQRGNVQEPAWRSMLGVAKHCYNGRSAAHKMSCGHPDYSEEETDEKMDRWATGPTTCDQFEQHLGMCGDCQYKGKIKSPIVLGDMTPQEIEEKNPPMAAPEEIEPVPDVPEADSELRTALDEIREYMPEGFYIRKDRKRLALCTKETIMSANRAGIETAKEIEVVITHDLFWFSNWSESTSSEDNAEVTVCSYINGAIRRYEMDQSLLSEAKKFAGFLAGRSIILRSGGRPTNSALNYAKAQMLRIREDYMREKVTKRFGLRYDVTGNLSSAHGRYIIHHDGTVSSAALAAKVRDDGDNAYVVAPMPPSETGSWDENDVNTHVLPSAKEHVRFFQTHYGDPEFAKYQLAILLGLASPLMAFVKDPYVGGDLPPNGLSVTLYSGSSGIGKTTMASTVVAAYGRPSKLVRGGSDITSTLNARLATMEIAGSMPVVMDEVSMTSEENAKALISAAANGFGKIRVNVKGEQLPLNTWALVSLMTTNRPQRDMVGGDTQDAVGVQNRMLELDVDDTPRPTQESMLRFDADYAVLLREHVGALGFLIQYAMVRAGTPRIEKMIDRVRELPSIKEISSDTQGRFLWRGMMAAEAMVALLEASYDITLFDMGPVRKAFRDAFDAASEYIGKIERESAPAETLNQFLTDIRQETAVTHGWGRGGQDVIINRPGHKISARYVTNHRQVFVSKARLDEWLQEKRRAVRMTWLLIKKTGALVEQYRSDQKDCYVSRRDLLSGTAESTHTITRGFLVDMDKLSVLVGGDIRYDDGAERDKKPDDATLQ